MARKRATAAALVGRTASASAIQPRKRPPHSTPTAVFPGTGLSRCRNADEPSRASLPSTIAGHAAPAVRLEAAHGRKALRPFANDGARERMLGPGFERGGNAQQLVRVFRNHIHNLRLPEGKGAGLVEHQGVELLRAFERLGVPDQDPGARGAPDA